MNPKWILCTMPLLLLQLFATPSPAQMSANPPEVGQKIRELGVELSPVLIETTRKLYAPLLAAAPKDGVKATNDVKYGTDERHAMDVYEPEKGQGLAPILVYLHGGGFVRGDKAGEENVGVYFARHGVVTFVMNYRFAPKNQWPSGAEDIAAVIRWIRQNETKHKGDVNRIFLMGSSAGAAHVATYVFFEEFQLKEGDGVAGAILFSGPTYDTSVLNEKDVVYYGTDKSKHPSMSVINNVDGRRIPAFLVVAELDMPSIVYQNHALINALYKRDKGLPVLKVLIGHNHISETTHFNTKDESAGLDILEFIRIHSGKGK